MQEVTELYSNKVREKEITLLTLTELEDLTPEVSVLAGSREEFPEELIFSFYEKSREIYIRNGFTKKEISLTEWMQNPEGTRSHYVMLIKKDRGDATVIGGLKLIQDIDNESCLQDLSTNTKTFPVHGEVAGYNYKNKIPISVKNSEVIEIGRLFVDNGTKRDREQETISYAEELIIGLCLYVKHELPEIKSAIGVIEKNLALRLMQGMEHHSRTQTSAIYTFPDFYPTKEILQSNHSPYFIENKGIPFFVDTNTYISRVLSYYQK